MRRRRERGASTVVVVSLAGLLLWLGAALGVVAAMVTAHRTAQAAADLAALAGAARLADGGDACAEAGAVAAANGASLTSCAIDDRDVRASASRSAARGGWARRATSPPRLVPVPRGD